jgi:hypothetical protein
MSNEMKNEIFKSFVYGMTIEEMSEIYETDEAELKKLLADNATEIENLRKYRAELEG